MTQGTSRRQTGDKEYKVRGDVFALLKSNGTKLVGTIREISPDGLSFQYIGEKKPLSKEGELAICSGNNNLFLYKVPCKILADSKLYKHHPSPISMRRCRVQFGELDGKHATQIENLIQNLTRDEP